MTNFKVIILEGNEDTNIYTGPTRVCIDQDTVAVEYNRRVKVYPTEEVKEIKVVVDR